MTIKKVYEKPMIIGDEIIFSNAICKGSGKHDQGVSDHRGHGYDDEWEHRHDPWEDPHNW